MDPIAQTAYYCCGARAADARSITPVCGDHLAERFMDADAQAIYARFAGFKGPNASNAARHHLIDGLLRKRLRLAPDLTVLLLGAGFDTRAFRLSGGHWIEFDQPSIIERKEAQLPQAQAPNPLQRVAIDFAHDTVAARLAPWAGTPSVTVVMEGVSMYLTPAQWRETTQALHRVLPGHSLVCDLMDATFARRFSQPLFKVIRELGGEPTPAPDDPGAFVSALGYRLHSAESIVGHAVAQGGVRLPRWLLNTLLRPLRDGYRLFEFDSAAA